MAWRADRVPPRGPAPRMPEIVEVFPPSIGELERRISLRPRNGGARAVTRVPEGTQPRDSRSRMGSGPREADAGPIGAVGCAGRGAPAAPRPGDSCRPRRGTHGAPGTARMLDLERCPRLGSTTESTSSRGVATRSTAGRCTRCRSAARCSRRRSGRRSGHGCAGLPTARNRSTIRRPVWPNRFLYCSSLKDIFANEAVPGLDGTSTDPSSSRAREFEMPRAPAASTRPRAGFERAEVSRASGPRQRRSEVAQVGNDATDAPAPRLEGLRANRAVLTIKQ